VFDVTGPTEQSTSRIFPSRQTYVPVSNATPSVPSLAGSSVSAVGRTKEVVQQVSVVEDETRKTVANGIVGGASTA
jgi:hypothetical protein